MFNRKQQISDMDAWVEERLSEYLDGTLSPQERASVEAHLKASARARASLESLRWTVNLVKQSPAPALPRQFTLPVTHRAPARGAPAWMV
ncbi:MAG: zf-HC2 domain-containing protein, partial [Anaerolineales bacterium]|nr:zf-HC2 domain-containing protein [Anaerolineales bacterium]